MSTGMRKENNGSGGRHAKKRLEEQGSGRVVFLFTSFVKGKGVTLAAIIIRKRCFLFVSPIFCNQNRRSEKAASSYDSKSLTDSRLRSVPKRILL